MMIEGSKSGSGSIPLINGSESRRPKNMWTRIRIRNTDKYRTGAASEFVGIHNILNRIQLVRVALDLYLDPKVLGSA
jgi:hypothetical protein